MTIILEVRFFACSSLFLNLIIGAAHAHKYFGEEVGNVVLGDTIW